MPNFVRHGCHWHNASLQHEIGIDNTLFFYYSIDMEDAKQFMYQVMVYIATLGGGTENVVNLSGKRKTTFTFDASKENVVRKEGIAGKVVSATKKVNAGNMTIYLASDNGFYRVSKTDFAELNNYLLEATKHAVQYVPAEQAQEIMKQSSALSEQLAKLAKGNTPLSKRLSKWHIFGVHPDCNPVGIKNSITPKGFY